MRRVVVGTAGHIDHGKTSLVEALTGIDCDRWQEEKERGITIDLGFAHLQTETTAGDPLQLSFVDVPGHERFLNNALAGLGGIRLMMLVVAADEGVKPQTEEHLAICSLLDIPAGLVALTKTDLVDAEVLELARLELEEALLGSPFEGVPILEVSAKTGQGMDELRTRLVDLAEGAELHDSRLKLPVRLPIDRAFHLKGLGVIVTGTLMTGEIRPGETLDLMPPRGRNKPIQVRIRSVQVHGESREVAQAGERTSLQVTGVDLEQLKRGQQLTTAGAFRASRTLLASIDLLDSAPITLDGTREVRFHLTSAETVGRMRALAELGAEGTTPVGPQTRHAIVELRLEHPVVGVAGDRFILRRPSPQTTLGGGRIVDPLWLRRRGASLAAAIEGLAPLAREGVDDGTALEAAISFWISAGGEAGSAAVDLAQRLGSPVSKVKAQLTAMTEGKGAKVLRMPSGAGHGERFLDRLVYQQITSRAKTVLAQHFADNRISHGLPKAEAARRITRGRGRLLADSYLKWLARDQKVVVQGDLITQPGRGTGLSDKESSLSDKIVKSFEKAGLTPPPPPQTCEELNAKPQIFDGLLRFFDQGRTAGTDRRRFDRLELCSRDSEAGDAGLGLAGVRRCRLQGSL